MAALVAPVAACGSSWQSSKPAPSLGTSTHRTSAILNEYHQKQMLPWDEVHAPPQGLFPETRQRQQSDPAANWRDNWLAGRYAHESGKDNETASQHVGVFNHSSRPDRVGQQVRYLDAGQSVADCNSRCLPCADPREARTNTHAYHKPLWPRAQCTPTHLVRWSRPLQHMPYSLPSWVRLRRSVSALKSAHLQSRQIS